MSIPVTIALVAAYLLISRCAISFFYGASKGIDITKSDDKLAFLIPPFGEFLLIFLTVKLLFVAPVSKLSSAGIVIHRLIEDKEVKRIALKQQRIAYEMKLAEVGLIAEDIPAHIKAGDLELYIKAQRELGIIPESVDIEKIRKELRKSKNNKKSSIRNS